MTDHHPDGEGSPDATVPEATLDPILTAYFADLAERGVPKVWEVTPQQARDMFHIRARMMRELDPPPELPEVRDIVIPDDAHGTCLLYTSDAADERSSVDLGGRRIIKKKKRPCPWLSLTLHTNTASAVKPVNNS